MPSAARVGRNDPCPCGSGKKYKHCCLQNQVPLPPGSQAAALASGAAIRRARELHRVGRLQEAQSLYRQVLESDPEQPEALHMLGVLAHQAGSNDVAAALIERAVQANPSDPSARTNLGIVYTALDRLEEAVESYRAALALEPRFANAHSNLGLALRRQGKDDEAVACFRRAIEISPSLADAHNNLGSTLLDRGESDAAILCFRRALAVDSDHFLAYSNLGNALLAKDQLDEAIRCYQRALAIRPDYVEAHYNLGTALKELGKPEEAVASLRTALALRPSFAEAHNTLGAALQDLGRLPEAIASVQAALDLKPGYPEALFNLHSLLLEPGRLAPSIECLRRAVLLRPDHAVFRFFLGMLLDCSGDGAGAAEHFALVAQGSVEDRARLDAWQHLRSASTGLPPVFGSPIQAFRVGLDAATKEGLVLEFGVRFGTSIRQIAALAHQNVHGFDSFQGLPEDWHGESRGSYTTRGALPVVPGNVVLHAGWFEDTLPVFLAQHPGPVRFVNVDCDLYSSTATVLDHLSGRIVPGTVIVFDEYINHEHWRDDEFRAFQEAVARHGWRYEYLCFSFSTRQVVVRIL
jgi:tetratricopeptide (TPR) repeat protein